MVDSAEDALFGRLAVNRRLISFDQLLAATAEVSRRPGAKLAEVVVDLGLMTPEQVKEVGRQQQEILARRIAEEERQERQERTVVESIVPLVPAAPAGSAGSPGPVATTSTAPTSTPPAPPTSTSTPTSIPTPTPTSTPTAAPATDAILAAGAVVAAVDDPWNVPSGARVVQPVKSVAIPIAFLEEEPLPPPTPTSAFEDALAGPQATARRSSPPTASARYAALSDEARTWLITVLAAAVRQDASDIHVHAGEMVRMRRYGALLAISDRPLPPSITELGLRALLNDEDRARFDASGQVDCGLSIPDVGRFRVNVYRQQAGIDGVFRVVKPRPPTLQSLNLPPELARLTTFHQGIVLVTGPASSGKSSTLAALVHMINEERAEHVVTIEDPIEVLHPSIRCVVNQRQAGRHTESFARALRAALREDPDVIVIGEMRDRETAQLALTAAETGHLVLATLHTQSAVRTINRVIGEFPPAQQPNVRAMLAESLRAVVSQRLLPRRDGLGVVPAVEVLMATPAVANLIRESRTHQIRSTMQTGTALGMQTLEGALSDLVARGFVTLEAARRVADEPKQVVGPATAPAPGSGG
jgi:twitching motility protein PilT